jgi:hypothetical protein
MSFIERSQLQDQLCRDLQTDYVALLGQRGTGIRTLVKSLTDNSPVNAIQFMYVPLPEGIDQEKEFKEAFLDLLQSASPPIAHAKKRASLDSRLRKTLEMLGNSTSARYLVIMLHVPDHIPEKPVQKFFLMLRDCHNQRDLDNAYGKLRFLVAGYVRLWHLCYHKTAVMSPLNIAVRHLLPGVSPEEIQHTYQNVNADMALTIKNLTDGVPALIHTLMHWPEQIQDIWPIFKVLQDHWNALSPESQQVLQKRLEGVNQFPQCWPDGNCPQIPDVGSPWLETFWKGFLKVENYKLTWRSPIHQAFIEHRTGVETDVSKHVLRQIGLIKSAICPTDTVNSNGSQTSTTKPDEPVKHKSSPKFDVFLAHNSTDKPQVEAIGKELKRRNLKIWIDKEQIPPGRWFQDVIQKAIPKVKSAAIFIGPQGLGKWQAVELRSFISQCVERNIPIIPVLLPGVIGLPEELLFLKELNWVQFKEKIDEVEALDNLEWGITGIKRIVKI